MKIEEREVLVYVTGEGRCPYTEWFYSLKDQTAQTLIRERLSRVRAGNLGDHKILGAGLMEFRLHFGPGLRIYAGQDGRRLIILVCGGDKGSQRRDMGIAAKYWGDYRRRTNASN